VISAKFLRIAGSKGCELNQEDAYGGFELAPGAILDPVRIPSFQFEHYWWFGFLSAEN
jgi:hypothetical protein